MNAGTQLNGEPAVLDVLFAIRPGSKVDILVAGEDVAVGTVLQLCVEGDEYITYEVAWWNGGERRTAWLKPHEVRAANRDLLQIGFHALVKNPLAR